MTTTQSRWMLTLVVTVCLAVAGAWTQTSIRLANIEASIAELKTQDRRLNSQEAAIHDLNVWRMTHQDETSKGYQRLSTVEATIGAKFDDVLRRLDRIERNQELGKIDHREREGSSPTPKERPQ